MSEAERTTPAPESATPTISPTTKPAKKKRKVTHVYMVKDIEIAYPLGLAVVSICGRKTTKAWSNARASVVEVVGGLMAIPETRDCKHCIAGYERRLRIDAKAAR